MLILLRASPNPSKEGDYVIAGQAGIYVSFYY